MTSCCAGYDCVSASIRLAFFEVKYQFYRREELIKEAAGHYGEQVALQPSPAPLVLFNFCTKFDVPERIFSLFERAAHAQGALVSD